MCTCSLHTRYNKVTCSFSSSAVSKKYTACWGASYIISHNSTIPQQYLLLEAIKLVAEFETALQQTHFPNLLNNGLNCILFVPTTALLSLINKLNPGRWQARPNRHSIYFRVCFEISKNYNKSLSQSTRIFTSLTGVPVYFLSLYVELREGTTLGNG